MAYLLRFLPDAVDHLRSLRAAERTLVLETVERQLSHQPEVETRNRKPLRPNPFATWELRIGDLRVFYDIVESDQAVDIVAVGRKMGSEVHIAGEIVELGKPAATDSVQEPEEKSDEQST